MNKYTKLLAVLALLLICFPAITQATADEEITLDDIDIYRVDIDEFEISPLFNNIARGPFYAGEKINVKVYWWTYDIPANYDEDSMLDVKINVELDDEEEETEFFTVKWKWQDASSFVFELPEDIDPDVYTLNIELEDEFGERKYYSVKLDIVNQKHFVELYDVNFPQGLEVKAGQTLLVSAGVKNLGHETEEDIKVSASIPELGLYQRSQKFDLLTDEEEELSDDDDDEWKLYKDLYLMIPSNTVSGVYDLIVRVDFDDGDKSQEQRYSVVVGEGVAPGDAFISVDTTSQTFAQGKGAVYTIMFSEPSDYTIKVEGVNGWGTIRVDTTDDQAYVFVSANEDAQSGSYPFSVKVMSGSALVKEFDLTANVTAYQSSASDIKEGLQIGFAVLLVILIILGIILAAKKIGKSDSYEEPLMDEGETYY